MWCLCDTKTCFKQGVIICHLCDLILNEMCAYCINHAGIWPQSPAERAPHQWFASPIKLREFTWNGWIKINQRPIDPDQPKSQIRRVANWSSPMRVGWKYRQLHQHCSCDEAFAKLLKPLQIIENIELAHWLHWQSLWWKFIHPCKLYTADKTLALLVKQTKNKQRKKQTKNQQTDRQTSERANKKLNN